MSTLPTQPRSGVPFSRALVRPPTDTLARGITTSGLGAPDPDLARAQHAAYCRALEAAGLAVMVLPEAPEHPDACFMEDAAVVLPELAVAASFGAAPRRAEAALAARALVPLRPVAALPAGRLEGGDVLMAGRRIFVGLSERTDPAGAEALARLAGPLGYSVRTVPVPRAPHLKTSVTWLGGDVLVVAPELAHEPAFQGFERIVVPEAERYAACCLWLGDTVLVPAGRPRTAEAVARLGREVVELDMSEFEKMDGGLTCLSLRF
ncbi:MAG: dimethylarginine dimethylaminohydrolase family protein [Desulfovibrionaceae bacterium]